MAKQLTVEQQREQFEALRAKALAAKAKHEHLRAEATARYRHYLYAPAAQRDRIEGAHKALRKAEERFYAHLHKISPRQWTVGVASRWVVESLTFEDAVTEGVLSVMPDPAWGFSAADLATFAGPVKKIANPEKTV
jgi:hypothetical protein